MVVVEFDVKLFGLRRQLWITNMRAPRGSSGGLGARSVPQRGQPITALVEELPASDVLRASTINHIVRFAQLA